MTPDMLRTNLGPHPRVLPSIAIIEKLRIVSGIGRQSKYGWLDLIRFGDIICILSMPKSSHAHQ